MTEKILNSMSRLTEALSAEARDCLGESYLVTIDFENVVPGYEGEGELTVNRLKVSARSCFLQAVLRQDDQIVFKARAIFKANSALKTG